MEFKFHHLNLCSENVDRLSAFYRELLDLDRIDDEEHRRTDSRDPSSYSAPVDFVTDGAVEFHLATKDVNLSFRQKQALNPLQSGHMCFRTDDIEGFKARLEEKGIPYADYGVWAMANWYQIFFMDPDGNMIEVHQPM
jgi:glyoxylase I family protein